MGNLLHGYQLRAARSLTEPSTSLADLAKATGLSVVTLRKWEAADTISANSTNLRRVQEELEARGVVFVDTNGEGPGVRRRKVRS